MDKEFEEIALQRWYTNAQQHVKTQPLSLIILGKCKSRLPGDATSLPLGWLLGKGENYKPWWRVKKLMISVHCWWKCRMIIAGVKNSMAVPKKNHQTELPFDH